MSDPRTSQDFDLDEDLFDFPEVSYESDAPTEEEDLDEIFATFREASRQEELLQVPTHAPRAEEPEPAAPLPAPAPAPAPRAVAEPTVRPVEPAPRTGTLERERAAAPRAPAPAPARLSRGVVAIAVAVTVLNSAVALVVLRRPAAAPAPAEHAPAEHALEAPRRTETSTAHARTAEPADVLPDPEAVEASHAHPALDQAREHIARGEYASARQGVYGLLAIIDRLDDPRRGALEADCQFLIAQSLHLEALARMGDGR